MLLLRRVINFVYQISPSYRRVFTQWRSTNLTEGLLLSSCCILRWRVLHVADVWYMIHVSTPFYGYTNYNYTLNNKVIYAIIVYTYVSYQMSFDFYAFINIQKCMHHSIITSYHIKYKIMQNKSVIISLSLSKYITIILFKNVNLVAEMTYTFH